MQVLTDFRHFVDLDPIHQYIFDNLDFKSPFFLTYVCTALFSVQLPLYFILSALGITKPIAWSRNGENRRLLSEDADVVTEQPEQMLSHGETLFAAALICPLWFLANWTYNLSLSITSVTSSTVISTTSSLWTYILRCCEPRIGADTKAYKSK
jgi:solute carrier family 35 protein F5